METFCWGCRHQWRQQLIDAAYASYGRLDVLVNNAGLGGTADLVEMTDEQWSRVLDVTLTGTFRCTRAAMRRMLPADRGDREQRLGPGLAGAGRPGPLCRGQGRVMALTRCAAVEAAEHGVRVNAVAPSIAMHPFLAKVTSAELLEDLAAQEAFERPAEVWEVANVIVFLASDYSSYLTGEVISVSSQHP